MFRKEDKLYYTWYDFDECIKQCCTFIESMSKPIHVVTFYRGGLPLGTRLSNEFKLPLSIIDYQSYDGNTKEMSFMKNANICSNEVLYVVDDIMDSGNTINKAIDFLHKEFPNNQIEVFTIFGNNDKFKGTYYQHKHNKNDWIVFPWEMDITSLMKCSVCVHGEPCNKNAENIHCNIFNASYPANRSCEKFEYEL